MQRHSSPAFADGRMWLTLALRCAVIAAVISAGQSAGHVAEGADRKLSVWDPLPRSGNQPLLVVLCDFPDQAGVITGVDWAERFFGPGGFSDYFLMNSYGNLRYYGGVVGIDSQGKAVVNSSGVAYVRLPDERSFYGNEKYGFNTGARHHCTRRNSAGIVYDALYRLDTAGFDFSPYVNLATNRVENVIVVPAVYSYHKVRDADTSFLSTAYEMRWVFSNCPEYQVNSAGHFVSMAGHTVNSYTFCTGHTNPNDRMAAFGVCVHEQGHALGLQDWYDVGQYSLMHTGAWGPTANGDYPAHMSAFDKSVIGWTSLRSAAAAPTEVEYVLEPSHREATALKLEFADSLEYYVVENRQELAYGSPYQLGVAPRFCPGVLIWHIDAAIASPGTSYWNLNTVNTDRAPHFGITVREADADSSLTTIDHECNDTYRVGDVFDGLAAQLWSGEPSGVRIRVLTRPDAEGKVRIALVCPNCTGDFKPLTAQPTSAPTSTPTSAPSSSPTLEPTPAPTAEPSVNQVDASVAKSQVSRPRLAEMVAVGFLVLTRGVL